MSKILRVEKDGVIFDFNYNRVSSYHFEEQRDGHIAFVLKMIDEEKRHLFDNNESLKIQLIEEKGE